MKKAILGKKLGMTQIFAKDGRLIPVTVIEAGPCTVVQKKTAEKDGYEAIQVGFDPLTENRAKKLLTKPEAGHLKKAGVAPVRTLKEFRLDDITSYEVGQDIKADIFAEGDKIDVSGISKGHGFTGVIQRWNQSIGPKSHGSKYHRGGGAMAAGTYPGRVFKNKRMSGHYGDEKVTIANLEIIQVDAERNLLLVKGSVPGTKGGLLVIRNSYKA